MDCDHIHRWVPFVPDALLIWSKRGEDKDEVGCRGRVFKCAIQPCQMFLGVPHDRQLNEVEVIAA